MKDFFVAKSKNKTGKAIFYTFEIAALVVGVIMLIFGIYNATLYSDGGMGFMTFLGSLANLAVDVLVLYGLGRIVDCMMAKDKAEKAEEKKENKSEE